MKKSTPTKTISSPSSSTRTVAKKKTVTSVAKKRIVSRSSTLARPRTSSAKRTGKRLIRSMLLSRTFQSATKSIFGLFIASTALFGAYSFVSNTFAGDVVISKSEIISRVGKLTILPPGQPDAVVRVEDAETLKKQNAFYENVKEGDYIIMYPTMAVIYSLRTDSIVAIKKVGM